MESKKPITQRLRLEARAVLDGHDEGTRLLYTAEQCSICGAHLTIRQLNRVIIEGVPPVCLKDYKYMKGELEKLQPLMNQLHLL